MPSFTFTGDPKAPGTDPTTCELFGVVFPLGEAVPVDEKIAKRLRTHSHFTENGGNANLGDFDGDGSSGGSAAALTGLKAVHSGGGRYVINDGDTVVIKGLSKDDATAFNALSDEEKAAKVAAVKAAAETKAA